MPIARRIPTLPAVALGLGAVLGAAQPVAAENLLHIKDTGNDNTIAIVQSPDSGHVARVAVSGERNGAASPGYAPRLTGRLATARLTAGRIEQRGRGQSLTLNVAGRGNLFAMRQTGQRNVISGSIRGTANQAFVAQSGAANHVSFSQNGQRNTIAIHQSM